MDAFQQHHVVRNANLYYGVVTTIGCKPMTRTNFTEAKGTIDLNELAGREGDRFFLKQSTDRVVNFLDEHFDTVEHDDWHSDLSEGDIVAFEFGKCVWACRITDIQTDELPIVGRMTELDLDGDHGIATGLSRSSVDVVWHIPDDAFEGDGEDDNEDDEDEPEIVTDGGEDVEAGAQPETTDAFDSDRDAAGNAEALCTLIGDEEHADERDEREARHTTHLAQRDFGFWPASSKLFAAHMNLWLADSKAFWSEGRTGVHGTVPVDKLNVFQQVVDDLGYRITQIDGEGETVSVRAERDRDFDAVVERLGREHGCSGTEILDWMGTKGRRTLGADAPSSSEFGALRGTSQQAVARNAKAASEKLQKAECIHCGATDDNNGVRVRVHENEHGEHATVCNICVPESE